MGKAILLGGGDASKWVFRKLRDKEERIPVLGMIGEKHWLSGNNDVVDFVRPADIRDIMRKLSLHNITELAVFGKALSSFGWRDIPKATGIILKALGSGHPYPALPNVYYEAVKEMLDQREITLVSLGEILPEMRNESGSRMGVGSIPDFVEVYQEAVSLMRKQPPVAQKQGIVVFPDRKPFLEVSGTKTAIRTCIKKGWGLKGSILVKSEVPNHTNLDVPVIDDKLVELCAKECMKGIIAEKSSLVVAEENVREILEKHRMSLCFV